MLHHAYYWRERVPGSLVSRYVRGWGRPGDTAVIALDGGFPVGAAWYRVFKADEPGYGFVDERTPSWRSPSCRRSAGKGVGEQLLLALIERAREAGYALAQPQRRAGQPARKLYERHGFRGRRRGAQRRWTMVRLV